MGKDQGKAAAKVWACLTRAQTRVQSVVEADLKSANLPPLAWYDVLLELQRVGKKGLRPFELERELLLPQPRLSRLLDRIEAEALIERLPCQEDGRGHTIVITAAGRKLRRRMGPIYGKALNDAVGTNLTVKEAATLGRLLEKLYEVPS